MSEDGGGADDRPRGLDAGGPVRVLVLDDDDGLRRAWEKTAERWAGRVLLRTAATEAEARAVLAEHAVDLALCDFRLGGGLTSEALVRDLHARGFPRVAVVSGDAASARKLFGPGVIVFDKPATLRTIFDTLKMAPPAESPNGERGSR